MEAIITDRAVDYKNNLSKGSRNEEQEILRNFRGTNRQALMINTKTKIEGKVKTIQIFNLCHQMNLPRKNQNKEQICGRSLLHKLQNSILVHKYLNRRRHLFINSPKIFFSLPQIREIKYLLIIITAAYIILRTDGSNVTSLQHDFFHLPWFSGCLILISTWATEFPQTAGSISKRTQWWTTAKSAAAACELRTGSRGMKGFVFLLLYFSYLSRAEFKPLTTLLQKGPLPWASCQRAMMEPGYQTCCLVSSFSLPCLH